MVMRRLWPLWVASIAVVVALGWPRAVPAADEVPDPAASSASVATHDMAGVACAHCHDDPHQGQVSGGCATCHNDTDWSPSTLTVTDHADFAFPLEGLHAQVSCGGCHVDGALTGLPQTCNECHLDRHRGKLGEDCTECHSVHGFTPVEGFLHADRTGFELVGVHDGKACDACHQGDNGRAMRVTMDVTCQTCHAEGHGPLGAACEDCHASELATWNAARAAVDHAETGFRLERRHQAVGCAGCHPVGEGRPAAVCLSCHDDVHSGQLSTVCSDCHQPDRWRLARFDHDRTGWPLRGRHFVTACIDCHTNQRWMGLRTECWDCHALEARAGPPEIPAHTTGLADCSDCHTTWSWR